MRSEKVISDKAMVKINKDVKQSKNEIHSINSELKKGSSQRQRFKAKQE